MSSAADHVLDKARDHIERSFRLIDRQEAFISALQRDGRDIGEALALHYAMYRTLVLMIESLDCLEAAKLVQREPASNSLDEWLRMLTLASQSYSTRH